MAIKKKAMSHRSSRYYDDGYYNRNDLDFFYLDDSYDLFYNDLDRENYDDEGYGLDDEDFDIRS